MNQSTLTSIIREQTDRALWEVRNVIDCVPDTLWEKPYCASPCWQHIYHTLHSLDLWYINPRERHYQEPAIHAAHLNNLDISPILAQFRHLHSHMGMLMGFLIADTGLWPRVLGLECPIPTGEYDKYL